MAIDYCTLRLSARINQFLHDRRATRRYWEAYVTSRERNWNPYRIDPDVRDFYSSYPGDLDLLVEWEYSPGGEEFWNDMWIDFADLYKENQI